MEQTGFPAIASFTGPLSSFAKSFLSTGFGDGDRELQTIETLLLALVIALLTTLFLGRVWYQRWSVNRLIAYARANLVSSEWIRVGDSAEVEVATPEGLRHGIARVERVEREIIQLAAVALSSAQERRAVDGTAAAERCDPSIPTGSQDTLNDLGTLSIGAPLRVTVYEKSAIYRFHANLSDRRIEEGVSRLYLQRPAWVERVQRREYYRVPVHLATTLTVISNPSGPANPSSQSKAENELLRGEIDNLSIGGFRIALSTPLEAGTRIRVRVPIDPLAGYSFEARVVRSSPTRDFGPHASRVQCEFLFLTTEVQDILTTYCFEQQIALRRDQNPLAPPE